MLFLSALSVRSTISEFLPRFSRPWITNWAKGKAPADAERAATIKVVSNFARAATPHFGLMCRSATDD
jgi:hypothetical protein